MSAPSEALDDLVIVPRALLQSIADSSSDPNARGYALGALRASEKFGGQVVIWSPIESAPRDGTEIMLWVEMPAGDVYATAVGYPEGWRGHGIGWWDSMLGIFEHDAIAGTPTHWAPLLEGPNGERSGGAE